MAAKKRNTGASSLESMADRFTEADGHQLAADMLRDVHDEWFNNEEYQAASPGAEWALLKGEVLCRYLDTVRNSQSATLERGFYSVLTDYIGSCMDGVVPDADFYEKESRHG